MAGSAKGASVDFLAGGGEMGALTRAHDWANSPLGPPETWPQSLRVTIRLMLNTGHPMFIFWGPDLIQFYNDAYRETMGPERHPSALGQRGRECWEEIWHIIGPQIDYVMSGKGATWNVDALVPVTRHGKLENVWWTYSYGPIDVEGEVGGVLVVCTDVTQEHLTREAARDQTRRLEQMFEEAPSFISMLRGPDHVFELANDAYRRLVGDRNVVGLSVKDGLPEVVEQGFISLLDSVYASGEPYVGLRTPVTLKDKDGVLRDRFVDFVYQPIMESDGRVSGIFVEGVDVTEHVRAEQDLQLINDELKHRVKNTLAVVSAIAVQTLRNAEHSKELTAFKTRLGTLARAHDILTQESSATAEIHDVVAAALAPHQDAGDRFNVSGRKVTLSSRQAISLALALNELATNAVKYGALSNASGRVDISWGEEPAPSGPVFRFLWRESGGPPVVAPAKAGFGSQLVKAVLKGDFQADVELTYNPEGAICRVTAPLSVVTAAETGH